METEELISIEKFCKHYHVPESFINSLNEFELIEFITYEQVNCVNKSQISDIEKMMRLHFDLQINLEGLDVILNLLQQVEDLQEEITELKNELNRYKIN